MTNLQDRKEKIQKQRSQTPWKVFVKEIASRCPISISNNNGIISRYPATERALNLVEDKEFYSIRESLSSDMLFSGNFWKDFEKLFSITPLPYTVKVGDNENTTFGDVIASCKNVYLGGTIIRSEDVLYSYSVKSSQSVEISKIKRNRI